VRTAHAFVAFAVLGAVPARAGNEDSFLYGDQAALTGGAVVATSANTASIWYNPAGLGLNDRGRFDLSGTAFTLRDRPIPAGLALDLPSGRVDVPLSSRKVFVVPATLAYARRIGEGLSMSKVSGIGTRCAKSWDKWDLRRHRRRDEQLHSAGAVGRGARGSREPRQAPCTSRYRGRRIAERHPSRLATREWSAARPGRSRRSRSPYSRRIG
jgi:hypothetical protein